MLFKKSKGTSLTLPSSAICVTVTNIIDPYRIRICHWKDYEKKIQKIQSKLLSIMITDKVLQQKSPSVNDFVLVNADLEEDVSFSGLWCRGIVCSVESDPISGETYNIFLIDYGTCMNVRNQSPIVVPTNVIEDKSVSFTIGLYNVLPALWKNGEFLILEEWLEQATHTLKMAIEASDAAYFDCLTVDTSGQKYGELYLEIADTIVSSREVLLSNQLAVVLSQSLLAFINNQEYNTVTQYNTVEDKFSHKMKNALPFMMHSEECIKTDNPNLEENKRNIINVPVQAKDKWKKRAKDMQQKVFIYAKKKYAPLSSVSDARFPIGIHKAWNGLVRSPRPTRLQSYIWPAIHKGEDVYVIGTQGSGKTFGTVVAVCAKLAALADLPKGKNPSALILCSSSSHVLSVYSLCIELLQSYPSIHSVAALNGQSIRSLCARIFNGCQILISTVSFLLRFMETYKNIFSLVNLQYLLLDDADVIFYKYRNYLSEFFQNNINGQSRRMQTIISATHYTVPLERFNILNYYICIGSFIEAAAFKKIFPEVHWAYHISKKKHLEQLLNEEYKERRTLIVCENAEEVDEVSKFLKNGQTLNLKITLAHENMNLITLRNIKQYWDASVIGSHSLLIASDEVLPDLNITNAEWLIHYSLLMHFKTRYNFTFSTLLENLEQDHPSIKVSTILDKRNSAQFLGILRLTELRGMPLPNNYRPLIKIITAILEKEKRNRALCNLLKSLGFCVKRHKCSFRHLVLPDCDMPITDIQIGDRVKLMPICIHSATHISARIISYIDCKSQKEIIVSGEDHLGITTKVQQFYSFIENRRRPETIDVGSTYGLEEIIDNFKRVRILQTYFEETGQKTFRSGPKFADIKYIDSGHVATKIDVSRLLHIPEELAELPQKTLEVFLTGIMPNDMEYSWNELTTEITRSWFQDNMDETSYPVGTVMLHISDTIWVDTLQICTNINGTDVVGSSVKELLQQNGAVVNKLHIDNLYKLCESAKTLEIDK